MFIESIAREISTGQRIVSGVQTLPASEQLPYLILSRSISKGHRERCLKQCCDNYSLNLHSLDFISPEDNLFFYEPELVFIDANNKEDIDFTIDRLKEESLYNKCSLMILDKNREDLKEYLEDKLSEVHTDLKEEVLLSFTNSDKPDTQARLTKTEARSLIKNLSC